jgi:hypothetical protein
MKLTCLDEFVFRQFGLDIVSHQLTEIPFTYFDPSLLKNGLFPLYADPICMMGDEGSVPKML